MSILFIERLNPSRVSPFCTFYHHVLLCHLPICSTVVEFTVIHKDSGLLVNGTVVLEKLQQYLGGGELRGMTIKKFDTKGVYVRTM